MYKKYMFKVAICVLIIVISLLLYTSIESFEGESGSGYNVGVAISIWRLATIGIAFIVLIFLLVRVIKFRKK
jgi:hypothetical protein